MALLLIARKWCKFQTEARQAVAFKGQESEKERARVWEREGSGTGGDLGVKLGGWVVEKEGKRNGKTSEVEVRRAELQRVFFVGRLWLTF